MKDVKGKNARRVGRPSKWAINVRLLKLNPRNTTKPVSEVLSSSDFVFDTNASYQRGFVWKAYQMQCLLNSLVAGRELPAIHVCAKSFEPGVGEPRYWVIDGKQRLETIKRFARNECKVEFVMDSGDILLLAYKDIKEFAKVDKNCCEFLGRFNTCSIRFNMYDELTEDVQRGLFEALNNHVGLSANEKIFCNHCSARTVFRYIWNEKIRSALLPLLPGNLMKNQRDTHSRFTSELLIHMFGPDLKSTSHLCEDAMNVKPTVAGLEKKFLATKGFDQRIIPEDLELFFSRVQIKQIDDILSSFKYVMQGHTRNTKGKAQVGDAIWLQDCLVWLRFKFETNILTPSYLKENFEKFFDLFNGFRNIRIKERENRNPVFLTNQHCLRHMESRLTCLDNLFVSMGFDTGIKNKGIPGDKLSILLNGPTTCEITGRVLTTENTDIDHVPPKSLSSENKFIPHESRSNRRKGNYDAAAARKLVAYQEKHEPEQRSIAV